MEHHLNDVASQSPSPSPSRATPNPTTFVQADANTFRDLVQKLTGYANDTEKLPVTCPSRFPSKTNSTAPRRPPFKLQERRQQMRNLDIKLGLSNSPHSHALRLDSPVTPLGSESLFYSTSGTLSPSSPYSPVVLEEEKAIAEKGFYLHPSPLNTPRGSQAPELLTLFPVASPCREERD